MEGFEKIDLKPNTNTPTNSPSNDNPKIVNRQNRFRFVKNKKFLTALGVFLLVFLFGILIPGFLTYVSAKKTYAQVNVTVAALKSQNIDLASKELDKTRVALQGTQNNLRLLALLRIVPFANTYYNDADHMIKAGFYAIDAGEIFLDSIGPYADVLGLKGKGTFAGGTAQDRIQTAVKTMGKITPKIDDISTKLDLVKNEVENVNPNDYPEFLASGKVKSSISKLKTLTEDGATFVSEARPLIKVMPELLGEPKEKKYLILFQNDNELRPTGGFITAYSVFRIDTGVIHVDVSDDIYKLDATLASKPVAPEPIRKYLANVPRLNLRDSNLSPDFEESMKTFSDLYEDAGGYKKVDGIIALDTDALVAVMNILGDIQVGGTTYTTKEDERCKCPQVIYALSEETGRRVQYIREDRKGIIGDLMYEIMNKAFSSEPSVYWGPLFQTMLSQVAQKHVLFYLYNEEAQKGIEALNAGGKILPWEGDYFHLNEANFGGAKSNLYITQGITQEYNIAKDGTIEKTVTVSYKNPFPPSNCNLELEGALCLNATLRDWFRVYVPKGSQLVSMKGTSVKAKTYDSLGKTTFEGFLEVRPLGTQTLTVKYILPFKLAKSSPLPVFYQKQPGTAGIDYSVRVNGRDLMKFQLYTDKKFNIDYP